MEPLLDLMRKDPSRTWSFPELCEAFGTTTAESRGLSIISAVQRLVVAKTLYKVSGESRSRVNPLRFVLASAVKAKAEPHRGAMATKLAPGKRVPRMDVVVERMEREPARAWTYRELCEALGTTTSDVDGVRYIDAVRALTERKVIKRVSGQTLSRTDPLRFLLAKYGAPAPTGGQDRMLAAFRAEPKRDFTVPQLRAIYGGVSKDGIYTTLRVLYDRQQVTRSDAGYRLGPKGADDDSDTERAPQDWRKVELPQATDAGPVHSAATAYTKGLEYQLAAEERRSAGLDKRVAELCERIEELKAAKPAVLSSLNVLDDIAGFALGDYREALAADLERLAAGTLARDALEERLEHVQAAQRAYERLTGQA